MLVSACWQHLARALAAWQLRVDGASPEAAPPELQIQVIML